MTYQKTDSEEEKKPKKLPIIAYVICKEPMCCQQILLNENHDPDLELAKHKKAVHNIPYPDWVDVIWDRVPGSNPSRGKGYEKKTQRKGTTKSS